MQIFRKLRIKKLPCSINIAIQTESIPDPTGDFNIIYLNETIVRTSYYRMINILKLDIFWPKFQNYQLFILFFLKRRLRLRDSVSENFCASHTSATTL